MLRGLPVLVVDDNTTNRRILEGRLAGWEMKPVTAATAEDALEAIRHAAGGNAPIKVVLTDLHMPSVNGAELASRIRQTPEAAGVKIIMMSSDPRESYGKQDIGVDASLPKPVKASHLLGVIRSVLGMAAIPQNESSRTETINSTHPSRVLVAEDNTLNQELIRRLLTKWGHSVVIANNGKEALSLLETESFDVVLMDVQMPEVNGLEATAAIRTRERETQTHMPIIALTAHALKGDREKCISAGMDDYISKPVQADKLFATIEAATAGGIKSIINRPPSGRALDADALMLNLDGDVELLRVLAKLFETSAATQLSEIDLAIARNDPEALERSAHAIKGSVATLHARAALTAAAMLEQIGGSRDLSHANPTLETLRVEIARLTQALDEMTSREVL